MTNDEYLILYYKALKRIANLDAANDSEEGYNEWGEADCFNQAQMIAKHALVGEEYKK